MKKILAIVLALGLNSFQAKADPVTIDQLQAKADAEYAQRDYTPDGAAHAQAALTQYQAMLTMTSDVDQLNAINLGIAKSIYFLGDSSADKATQKQMFSQGMAAADVVLKNFGVNDTNTTTLTDALAQSLTTQYSTDKIKMDALAEALYQKGANLGQWGSTDVVGALTRWPELRNIMDFLTKISLSTTDATGKATLVSYKSLHSFASYRVVGRGYYVIPGVLGGDKAKSEKYLAVAFNSSLAVDATGAPLTFSVDGYNNIYYTDVLRANNKAAQAKAILTAFVAADPKNAKIFPDQNEYVDIVKTQAQARDILSKM